MVYDNYYCFSSDDSPSQGRNQQWTPRRDCACTFVSRCLPIPCCKSEIDWKVNMLYGLIWNVHSYISCTLEFWAVIMVSNDNDKGTHSPELVLLC